jgi:hypothetical protein
MPIAQPLDGNYKPITAIVGTPITASATSATPATVAAAATLPGVAGTTTYINGFICTSAIPGANVVPLVTVTGTTGGTLSFQFPETTAFGGQLIIFFPNPIPASAPNTSIVVTVPALASSGNSAVVAYGFQL